MASAGNKYGRSFAGLSLLLCVAPHLYAQWTLAEAVRRAGENYAGVQVPLAEVQAAAARVQLARTAFLPKADLLAQVNRATRNNVFGMLLPQSVIAPISGPPLATNAGTNVWGTATGIAVSWEPFDFGFRQAKVDEAAAAETRASKAVARIRFEVEAAAAEAFFTVVAADETVRSARAAVERTQTMARIVTALANSGLKPEADAARARGEVAAAQGQLIQAEQAAEIARIALTRLTGKSDGEVQLASAPLLRPLVDELPASPAVHPALVEQSSAVEEAVARRKSLDLVLYPRFQLQSTVYARGTGANADGTTGGAAAGLGPTIYNWGVGFTVTYPLWEAPRNRAEKAMESQQVRAAEARVSQLKQDLDAQVQRARALVNGARRLAATTPAQLEAARVSEQQARARYQGGLTNIIDVADTQRFLLQAEIDDSLARLSVWRAQLALAIAQGDLQPLLDKAGR